MSGRDCEESYQRGIRRAQGHSQGAGVVEKAARGPPEAYAPAADPSGGLPEPGRTFKVPDLLTLTPENRNDSSSPT